MIRFTYICGANVVNTCIKTKIFLKKIALNRKKLSFMSVLWPFCEFLSTFVSVNEHLQEIIIIIKL